MALDRPEGWNGGQKHVRRPVTASTEVSRPSNGREQQTNSSSTNQPMHDIRYTGSSIKPCFKTLFSQIRSQASYQIAPPIFTWKFYSSLPFFYFRFICYLLSRHIPNFVVLQSRLQQYNITDVHYYSMVKWCSRMFNRFHSNSVA